MEFPVGTMEKLAELLREPEPEVLQGEDLPSTDDPRGSSRIYGGISPLNPEVFNEVDFNAAATTENELDKEEPNPSTRRVILDTELIGEDPSQLWRSGYEITSIKDKANSSVLNSDNIPKTIEEYEQQEAEEAEKLGQAGAGIPDRKTPAYTMNYQQSVTAEDVFLQIGPKTPSSASCENLVVKIKMPGDKKENVDLSVNTNSVTVNSPQYYLKLPLPHEINPDTSKANWDSTEETLLLTLKLDREFDFVNF